MNAEVDNDNTIQRSRSLNQMWKQMDSLDNVWNVEHIAEKNIGLLRCSISHWINIHLFSSSRIAGKRITINLCINSITACLYSRKMILNVLYTMNEFTLHPLWCSRFHFNLCKEILQKVSQNTLYHHCNIYANHYLFDQMHRKVSKISENNTFDDFFFNVLHFSFHFW